MTTKTKEQWVRETAEGMASAIAERDFITSMLRKLSVRYGFRVDIDVTDLLKRNLAFLKRWGLPEDGFREAVIDRFRRAGYDASFYIVERTWRRNLQMVRIKVSDPLPDELEHFGPGLPDDLTAPKAVEFARDYKQNRVKAVADSCERALEKSGKDSIELNMRHDFYPLMLTKHAELEQDNSTYLDDLKAELESRGYEVWHYGVRDTMLPQRTPVLEIRRPRK